MTPLNVLSAVTAGTGMMIVYALLVLGKFYQAMAWLAIKKHQLANLGDERGNRAKVERFRREIAAMQRSVLRNRG